MTYIGLEIVEGMYAYWKNHGEWPTIMRVSPEMKEEIESTTDGMEVRPLDVRVNEQIDEYFIFAGEDGTEQFFYYRASNLIQP